MTKITEFASWEDAIDLITRGERVEGGRTGAVNIQAQKLANRTLFLKNLAESAISISMTTSATYDDVEQAQKALNDGLEQHRYFTVKESDGVWSQRYENVSGTATPTGEKLLNADGVNFIVVGMRTDFDELVASPKVMKEITAHDIVSGEIDINGRYAWKTKGDGSVEIQKLIANSKEVTLEDGSRLSELIPFKLVTIGTTTALVDSEYRYAWRVKEDGVFDVQKLRVDASKLTLSDRGESLADALAGTAESEPNFDYRLTSGDLFIYNNDSGRVILASNNVDTASPISGGIAYKKQNAEYVYLTKKLTSQPRYSNRRIICAGDSLTAGAGGNGTSYPATLATLTGLTALNRGYAGRASADIALHMGALRPLLSVSNGKIPASGSVAVTTISPSSGWRLGQDGETFPGTLAGVPGKLMRAKNDTWSFTRTTAGDAVTVPDDSEFICTEHAGEDDSITVSWIGRNNYATAFAEVEKDTELFHEWVNVYNRQHIVIGMTTTAGEPMGSNNYKTITGINETLRRTYGDCYVDMLSYLVNNGLVDAGIMPTEGDSADIQMGIIPRSLRSDDVHLNAAGYSVAGKRIYQQMTLLGWV